jgi:4-hydroxy-4-methyl-2-oxoglutarate aldolase
MLDGHYITSGTVFDPAPSLEDEMLDVMAEVGVSNVAAALGATFCRQLLLDGHAIPRVSGTGAVAGTAVTVFNPPGSNGMMNILLHMLRPRDMIVVEGCHETAQWGDQLTTLCVAKGVAAGICDGAVRDLERIREMGFSLWGSRVFACQGYRKDLGFLNAPVKVGGMVVRPGDLVIADSDGLLAVPRALVPLAYERALTRRDAERQVIEQAKRGEVPSIISADAGASFEVTATLERELMGQVERVGKTWQEWLPTTG